MPVLSLKMISTSAKFSTVMELRTLPLNCIGESAANGELLIFSPGFSSCHLTTSAVLSALSASTRTD